MKKKNRMPTEAICAAPTMADKARQRQYEIEDGLRTLQRAGEIVKDKGFLKEIKSFAKKQINDLNKVAK